MISVVLIDGDDSYHSQMNTALGAEAGIEVTRETSSGFLGLEAVRKLRPDILITDLLTSDLSGLEVISRVHRELPQVGIIVWSDYTSSACVRLVVRAGARGFVARNRYHNAIVVAIRRVALGQRYFYPAEFARYISDLDSPGSAST